MNWASMGWGASPAQTDDARRSSGWSASHPIGQFGPLGSRNGASGGSESTTVGGSGEARGEIALPEGPL